jgi:hypothetical protein
VGHDSDWSNREQARIEALREPRPLTDRAFIDWDGWLWDWDGNTPLLVSKHAETWLAGYRARQPAPEEGK